MKVVTMQDVATKAGVSKSTVSQYINKRYEYMSVETRMKIKEAIEELNYSPNHVAKSLKQKRTATIGVIVANILHTFSTQVIRAIEDYCIERQFNVIVCNADDNPVKEKMYIDTLLAKQVDGMIVFPTGGNMESYQMMQQRQYPLVFVDRTVKGITMNTILLDNMKASSLAVEHFVTQGYERIAFLTTSLERNITPRIERLEGYLQAMQKHQLPIVPQYYKGVKVKEMQQALEDMYALQQRPQAIICANDISLLETLKFVKKQQLQIPKDLAIIGIDEVDYADIYAPPLTVISQPTFEMGRRAAQLLIQFIEQQDVAVEIEKFEPQLITRQST